VAPRSVSGRLRAQVRPSKKPSPTARLSPVICSGYDLVGASLPPSPNAIRSASLNGGRGCRPAQRSDGSRSTEMAGTEARQPDPADLLTDEQLAYEGGASVDLIRRLVDAGILRPESDGRFPSRYIRRVRLIRGFDQSGLPIARVQQALAEGFLDFDLGDDVWPAPAHPAAGPPPTPYAVARPRRRCAGTAAPRRGPCFGSGGARAGLAARKRLPGGLPRPPTLGRLTGRCLLLRCLPCSTSLCRRHGHHLSVRMFKG